MGQPPECPLVLETGRSPVAVETLTCRRHRQTTWAVKGEEDGQGRSQRARGRGRPGDMEPGERPRERRQRGRWKMEQKRC